LSRPLKLAVKAGSLLIRYFNRTGLDIAEDTPMTDSMGRD